MARHCKRLEYKCKCINISIRYACSSILWLDKASEFEVIDEMTARIGNYRTWFDNVEPDALRQVQKEIQERVESFVLAMRFLGNARFSQTDEILYYIAESGEEYQITNDIDIEAIIHQSKGEEFNYGSVVFPAMTFCGSASTSPAPLPQSMPSVPLILKRHILNVLQAEELDSDSDHYEDEQLKRWFLIIEELETDTSKQEYKDLRSVRNFVSHPKVDKKETITFLEKELPSSVDLNLQGRKEARYLRVHHRTLLTGRLMRHHLPVREQSRWASLLQADNREPLNRSGRG